MRLSVLRYTCLAVMIAALVHLMTAALGVVGHAIACGAAVAVAHVILTGEGGDISSLYFEKASGRSPHVRWRPSVSVPFTVRSPGFCGACVFQPACCSLRVALASLLECSAIKALQSFLSRALRTSAPEGVWAPVGACTETEIHVPSSSNVVLSPTCRKRPI